MICPLLLRLCKCLQHHKSQQLNRSGSQYVWLMNVGIGVCTLSLRSIMSATQATPNLMVDSYVDPTTLKRGNTGVIYALDCFQLSLNYSTWKPAALHRTQTFQTEFVGHICICVFLFVNWQNEGYQFWLDVPMQLLKGIAKRAIKLRSWKPSLIRKTAQTG